jgi:methyltransferase
MTALHWYTFLIFLTAIERLIEMRVAKSNAQWSFANGGKEYGQGHFPFMVSLHTVFIVACLAEVWLLQRSFNPLLGYSMLILALAAQALRWWCITTLGKRWNARVIIVPGLQRISNGPYQWLPHPNYIAVATEGFALPLIHGAWLTALGFTLLNAGLMYVRITTENRALSEMESSVSAH